MNISIDLSKMKLDDKHTYYNHLVFVHKGDCDNDTNYGVLVICDEFYNTLSVYTLNFQQETQHFLFECQDVYADLKNATISGELFYEQT